MRKSFRCFGGHKISRIGMSFLLINVPESINSRILFTDKNIRILKKELKKLDNNLLNFHKIYITGSTIRKVHCISSVAEQ